MTFEEFSKLYPELASQLAWLVGKECLVTGIYRNEDDTRWWATVDQMGRGHIENDIAISGPCESKQCKYPEGWHWETQCCKSYEWVTGDDNDRYPPIVE